MASLAAIAAQLKLLGSKVTRCEQNQTRYEKKQKQTDERVDDMESRMECVEDHVENKAAGKEDLHALQTDMNTSFGRVGAMMQHMEQNIVGHISSKHGLPKPLKAMKTTKRPPSGVPTRPKKKAKTDAPKAARVDEDDEDNYDTYGGFSFFEMTPVEEELYTRATSAGPAKSSKSATAPAKKAKANKPKANHSEPNRPASVVEATKLRQRSPAVPPCEFAVGFPVVLTLDDGKTFTAVVRAVKSNKLGLDYRGKKHSSENEVFIKLSFSGPRPSGKKDWYDISQISAAS